MSNSYVKDPTARLDYTWGWSDWLTEVADTISTATVTVPDGLTKFGPPVVDDTTVTQWIEGGSLDGAYRMVCQITTAAGRIDERSIYLTIRDQ